MPWLPYCLRRADPHPLVDWCDLPDTALCGPFFDPALENHRRQAAPEIRSTALAELVADPAARLPDGFIFHVSRCGSTLLARQLAAVAGCRVLSEPNIVEALLRAPWLGEPERGRHLQALFAAFAARSPPPRATLLKFSARALLDHVAIRTAAPAVPCLVLYRDPAEVLVALVGNRRALPPGLVESGLLAPADVPSPPEPCEFWARVLARQFAAAGALAGGANVRLLHYDALPDAAWQRVAPQFGLNPDAGERAAMQAVAQRDAKSDRPFVDDRARKRAAIDAVVREAVERHLAAPYARLETLRQAQDRV